ncbi:glycoside hydrolase family 128 protein [Periconia macrospinosa]|uniref:Glycoside hydrolase family 128 protein n=1 Tax=Periconia macrospinosa TaxID=97972 RepID=A0A2V1DDZ7_9PLEO|nr:glycoside hydrolase family 128 protein [Periconia macrospinosa]
MSQHHKQHPRRYLHALALLTALTPQTTAQENHNSKRGLAYVGNTHGTDNALLTSTKSPISWYYNWSPYPPSQVPSQNLEFVPLIHGVDGASDPQTARQIDSLPQSSTHLLSFNEPDGTTGSGGSAIEPDDAAKAYIEHIVPLRERGRKWKISHPSTTGSGNGLDWLRKFNESCYKIDKQNGCPTDFIAAHWYGNFEGLAGWLGTLNEYYNTNTSRNPPLKIWITELALPQLDADANAQMMNQTLPYLDSQDYVEKYSWFGAFRPQDANGWTGDGVALFDGDGGLTKVGALYMGGENRGFKEGQRGEEGGDGVQDGARHMSISWGLLLSLTFAAGIFSTL